MATWSSLCMFHVEFIGLACERCNVFIWVQCTECEEGEHLSLFTMLTGSPTFYSTFTYVPSSKYVTSSKYFLFDNCDFTSLVWQKK